MNIKKIFSNFVEFFKSGEIYKERKGVSNIGCSCDNVGFKYNDVVRVKRTAMVPGRYLGRKGIIKEIVWDNDCRCYIYGLQIHDRIEYLNVLEDSIEKVN